MLPFHPEDFLMHHKFVQLNVMRCNSFLDFPYLFFPIPMDNVKPSHFDEWPDDGDIHFRFES
jgi:hypothetical protein